MPHFELSLYKRDARGNALSDNNIMMKKDRLAKS